MNCCGSKPAGSADEYTVIAGPSSSAASAATETDRTANEASVFFLIGSPRVLRRVGHGLLAVRRHVDLEVDRASVDLREVVALLRDLPIHPAEEVLLHDHVDGRVLVVLQRDPIRVGDPVPALVDAEV